MVSRNSEVYKICVATLQDNWRETHTIPANGPYPHQWLWDSAFNAIGWSTIDISRAQTEILHLLDGQWANGMLPNMLFTSGTKDKYIWQGKRNPNAPEHVDTTGITQPPMVAEAVVRIGGKLTLVERRSWYHDVYPALLKYHEWLFRERDPRSEGLIQLVHPWESGFDSNPAWIDQLHEHAMPWWAAVVNNRFGRYVIHRFRNDRHMPPGQRLDDVDAAVYQKELYRLRNLDWDSERILGDSKMLVEDLAFNCIFIRANDRLQEIAKTIGHKLPEELQIKIEQSKKNLEKFWDTGHQDYFSRNAATEKLIKEPSIMSLMPLYAGSITKERAAILVQKLEDKKQFYCPFPIPSVPFTSAYYQEKSYWQGPTWINTNWMIVDGLRRYGYNEQAAFIAQKSIELVEQAGPYEYFSARSGEPAGAEKFSWTSALTIDLIEQQHKK